MFRAVSAQKSSARPLRKRPKRRRPLIVDTLLAVIILIAITLLVSQIPQVSTPDHEWSGTPHIIDGDTIIINNQRLRLKGIDAPEIKQSCLMDAQNIACGIKAKQALQQKIGRQAIHCLGHARDKYQRYLAVCYLGRTDLNQWLVEQGHAVSYYDYPSEERDARLNKRGIWAGEFERPQEWRRTNNDADWQTATQSPAQDKYFAYDYIYRKLNNIYDRLFNNGGLDE